MPASPRRAIGHWRRRLSPLVVRGRARGLRRPAAAPSPQTAVAARWRRRRDHRVRRDGCPRRRTERRARPAAPARSVRRRRRSPTPAPGQRERRARRDPLQRRHVDRPIRLAGVDRLAAERLIELGERSGAIDEFVAAMDDRSGLAQIIGNRRSAKSASRSAFLGRLGRVVEQAGAEHVGRRFRRDQRRVRRRRAAEPRRSTPDRAAGRNVVKCRAAARGDHADRNVAGGDDRVERLGRDT